MQVYEQMKNSLAASLMGDYSAEQIQDILSKLNVVADNYDIQKKNVSLVVYTGNDVVPSLVRTFLVCKELEGVVHATVYNYFLALKSLFMYVNKEPKDITANDIRVFLYKYQQDRQVENTTIERMRICYNIFFSWASDEGYIDRNVMKLVKPIKYTKKERQPLTQKELEYVRLACKTPKERAIVEFFYSTGCRVSELVEVKKSDVNWETKTVLLFGKGSKYRDSYLNAKAEVYLDRYLSSRDDSSPYLFVSDRKPYDRMHKTGVEKMITIIGERVSGKVNKKITPHVFRHTTATTALSAGMPVENIQKLLGHENIATTMIYAKTHGDLVRRDHARFVV